MIYELIYSKYGQIDDKIIKDIYESLDNRDENNIIKADLSYLLSLSKNKDNIPILDRAIIK